MTELIFCNDDTDDFILFPEPALVVQLDRIPDSDSGGWGFESLRVH